MGKAPKPAKGGSSVNIGGNVSGHVVVGDHNVMHNLGGGERVYHPAPAPAPEVDVRVFISYRRDDADGHAGRLRDWLARRFGEERVFLDVAGIDPGEDFVDKLDAELARCDIVLVVIGRQWLAITDDDGRRKLDNPEDWVRVEVATALERRIPVVPVLVRGARMPAAADLPEPLKALVRRNFIEIGPQWASDVERLTDAVARVRSGDR